jgi:hypothetical protein
MRALRLASVAFEAERARLGLRVQREIRRVVFFVIAGIMAAAAFAMLHVIAWVAMSPGVSPLLRAIIIFVFDIAVAGILAMIAMRNAPTRAEIEALAIRRTAVIEARNGIGFSLIPIIFSMLRRGRRNRRR